MVDTACCEGGEFDFINIEVSEEEKQSREKMFLLGALYARPFIKSF